MNQILTDKT